MTDNHNTKEARRKLPISYVPRSQLDSVKKMGLLGMKAILKRPGLLERIADARGEDPAKMREMAEKHISSGRSHAFDGPNVMFKGPPDIRSLADNHPLKTKDLVPVRVDLPQLMKDVPDTRVHGMELMPYQEYDKLPPNERDFTKRHRDLKPEEIDEMMSLSGSQIWEKYEDLDGVGRYAPNVPHASIITPDNTIGPKYLQFPREKKAQGQEGLPTAYLRFMEGEEERCGFFVEIAITPEQIQTGLMFREEMPLENGMLFSMPERKVQRFWMKNTPLPLDMIFMDEDGTVVGIVEDTEPYDEGSYGVDVPSKFVLELNAGRARDCGITEGWKAVVEEKAGA